MRDCIADALDALRGRLDAALRDKDRDRETLLDRTRRVTEHASSKLLAEKQLRCGMPSCARVVPCHARACL